MAELGNLAVNANVCKGIDQTALNRLIANIKKNFLLKSELRTFVKATSADITEVMATA